MKKKVAILSWYNYDNYGTVLQAYALERVIDNAGYDSCHINYSPYKRPDISYTENLLKKSIKKLKEKVEGRAVKDTERTQKYIEFRRKYLKLTDKCLIFSDFDKLNDQFDAFVVGSDQIWSPYFFDERYYLDFVRDDYKKIAYAPSLGVTDIPYAYLKDLYKKNLDTFSFLSVREQQGARILSNILGEKIPFVLDPVFLLPLQEWETLASLKERKEKDYILCYFLGNNKKQIKKAKKYAQKVKKKLIVIPINRNAVDENTEYSVGPLEFLSLIKNASVIFTDSFHGMAFSIIFCKEFYVFERFKNSDCGSQNSRIYNSIDLFMLADRLVGKKIRDCESIDYNAVTEILSTERQKSLVLLLNALKDAVFHNEYSGSNFYITKNCCGCGICSVLCPKSAISIVEGEDGFNIATINSDKCVQCKKCIKICPMNDRIQNYTPINLGTELYSYISCDEKVLKKSSSGGLSYDIAERTIIDGGSCLGAVYDYSNNTVFHEIIATCDDIAKIQGSKYLQSRFIEGITKFLNNTNTGTIFGTPCQIAGVRNIIIQRELNDRYTLVDLVCHGVPSRLLWMKYLAYISNGTDIRYNEIVFRDKKRGWKEKYISLNAESLNYSRPAKDDIFYHFFDAHTCKMSSCYECPFREKSCADLRIGDFWGDEYRNNKSGVSECLIITEKGRKVFNSLNGAKELKCTNNYFKFQQVLNYSKPAYYDCLFEDFRNTDMNLKDIDKKYNQNMKLRRLFEKIYGFYKKLFKNSETNDGVCCDNNKLHED